MAHYAYLDEENVVTFVANGRDENEEGVDWESYYAQTAGLAAGRVKRTSYNTHANTHRFGGVPFRRNYAGVGYTYRADIDAFVPPQPYPSWTLHTATAQWRPPMPMPQDGKMYEWDENRRAWVSA